MPYSKALQKLCKFFQIRSEALENNLPKASLQQIVVEWAAQLKAGYQLTNQQYNFLLGRGW